MPFIAALSSPLIVCVPLTEIWAREGEGKERQRTKAEMAKSFAAAAVDVKDL